MRKGLILALLVAAVGVQSAVAGVVGLDFVRVANPGLVGGDEFDNGSFDAPPWIVITGTPGPEAGTTLTMRGGDYILLPVTTDPGSDIFVSAGMELTEFPIGSTVSLIVFGDAGEILSLSVIPGAAFVTDELANFLGVSALPSSPTADFLISLGADDSLNASVNGVAIASQQVTFGAVTAVGIQVVPEPATLCLFGLGCVMMGVRRRLNRARD